MEQEEIYRYLARSFPVWERLNAREQAGLAEHTAQVHYEKGARLHGAGTECIGVLFVMRGRLRAYMLSQEGREITLYRLGAGKFVSCPRRACSQRSHLMCISTRRRTQTRF